MQIDLYNHIGEKKGKYTLMKEMFDVEINKSLLHRAVVQYLANQRQSTAKAKTKGEVRGGGKKPWRQKGTGRARTGSLRNPVFRGGGVIFGPTGNENYSQVMPKKQRRKALFCALSQKALEGKIIGIDELMFKEIKTKFASTLLDKLPIDRNALFVMPDNNEIVIKSFSNIPYVQLTQANSINVYDLLKYETIIFLKKSLERIEDIWGKDAKDLYKESNKREILKKVLKEKEKETVQKKENKEKDTTKLREENITKSMKKTTEKKDEVKKKTTQKTPTAKKTVTKKVAPKKSENPKK
jgi:large subunit ribosomal protein L4